MALSSEPCRLIDADDKLVDVIDLPARTSYDGGPRSVIYRGKRFVETLGDGFYGPNTLVEVKKDADSAT